MSGKAKERIYHASLYLIAAVILLAAVAVTVARLALPNISQYKGQVEAWAESYME